MEVLMGMVEQSIGNDAAKELDSLLRTLVHAKIALTHAVTFRVRGWLLTFECDYNHIGGSEPELELVSAVRATE